MASFSISIQRAVARCASWRFGERSAILYLLAAVAILGLWYMALTPPFEGPDSVAHLGYVAYWHDHPGHPPIDAATAAISHELVQQPPFYYALAALATAPFPLSQTLAANVQNPHYPGLSHRATITRPGTSASVLLPARVAALVTLLGALLAVLATWGLVRAVLPDRPGLALASAAVVGFNPEFVFTAATITNDTWAAAMVALTLWLAVELSRRDGRAVTWGLVGLAAGAAALTKYNCLVVLPLVGLVLLAASGRPGRGWRWVVGCGCWVGIGAAALAGWWYGVNLTREGALVPLDAILSLGSDAVRPRAASLGTVLREAQWLPRSYWGVFGYGVVAPSPYDSVISILLVAAGLGLLISPWRLRGLADRRVLWAMTLFAGAWWVVSLAGVLRLIRLIHMANHGRLLFPAAPAIAILLVLGWWSLAPARARPWLLRAVPLFFFGLAVWQTHTLALAYAMPPALPSSTVIPRRLDAVFDGGATLVGVALPEGGAVRSGGILPITLYFSTRAPIARNDILFVHLNDAQDRAYGSYDGVPEQGRHPTGQWRPGEVFADTYDLKVSEVATDVLVTLSAGFYEPDTLARRSVIGANGQPVGDRAILGHVMIHRDPPVLGGADTPFARWSNGIVLADANVTWASRSGPDSVSVTWITARPVANDLTVFAQLLDDQGGLVDQVDRRPRDGAAPTDTWVPGYPVEDVYTFALAVPTWNELIIGFYDAGGHRVPLAGAGAADHFVVLRR